MNEKMLDIENVYKAVDLAEVYDHITPAQREVAFKTLDRLAALEKVCQEIVDSAPAFATILDDNGFKVHCDIAQELKAVLEEV